MIKISVSQKGGEGCGGALLPERRLRGKENFEGTIPIL